MDLGILFLPAMLVVFYFFFIRPQMKQQKKLKNLQSNLKKGQLIITNGGIHGKVIQSNENQSWVMVDIGNTKIKVERSSITSTPSEEEK